MNHPRADESFVITLAAGGAAALVGVTGFWIFHTLWILDIPTVFFEGLIHAIPATLALAWAIRCLRAAGRFGELQDGLLFGVLLWVPLVPYEFVGVIWGPFEENASFREAMPVIWVTVLSMPVGAALGWALTRKVWPAVAFAAATLTVDMVLGGGIAFSGGRGVILGLFFWLLPTHMLAAMAVVGVHVLLAPRASETAGTYSGSSS